MRMRLRRFPRPFRRAALPKRSAKRWIVVGCGLGIVVAAVVAAAGPYQQTTRFRDVVACDQGPGDCFRTEHGSIAGRRTYTTTSTQTDANGNTTSTTTTHYEITWQRADGARKSHDVAPGFYNKAGEGQAADLRIWRGEVVGVEVMGATAWFLPQASKHLAYWIYLGYFGLGVLLWGLFFGWWDGLFMLAFRTFAWMFMVFVPADLFTHALAYGQRVDAGLVGEIVLGLFFVGIAGSMVLSSLDDW